jgi:hypothetical protein
MLKKINKTWFYCEKRTFMVPSGTIKEVTPTGTSTLLDRLACKGGKNQKPRYWRKNADFPRRTRWTTTIAAKATRFAQVRRSGDGRSGIRTGTAAHRRKHCRCVRPLSGPSVPSSVVSASVRPSVTGASVRVLCRRFVRASVRQKFVRPSLVSPGRLCQRRVVGVSVPAVRWPVVRATLFRRFVCPTVRRPGRAAATPQKLCSKSNPQTPFTKGSYYEQEQRVSD